MRRLGISCVRTLVFAVGFAVVFAGNAASLDAQLSKFSPFKRRNKARQSDSIELTEKQGPWLIMCASFGGDEGLEQAKALVRELRADFNLSAFIYAQNFDFSQKIVGNGWEKYQTETGETALRQPMMRTLHKPSYEYAVMVGNFPSPEDGRAQKTLVKIKHLKPACLHVSATVDTSQRFGVWREIQRQISPNPAVRKKGPMRAAFVMPNPTIPKDYFQARGIDKLVVKMNKNVRYGLFKCPEPFSVRVASFGGKTTFNSSEIEQNKKDMARRKKHNQGIQSELADAFDKAHLLTVELRKNGIEAYEFHDRNESYVCVGSYPWATRKLPSGKDELNPEIENVILKFKARVDSIGGMQGAVRPKSIPSLAGKKIYFDIQPLPVLVPKLESAGLINRR